MAPSKQARRSRQAVSAKKRASHGGSRARSVSSLSVPTAANGNGQSAGRTRAADREVTASADATVADLAQPPAGGVSAWVRTHPLQLATWVLSLFALAVSIYLTITHYDTSVTLACSDKGIVNCAKVTTSSQSMVFGIFPVAVLGLAFYVFMAAINSPLGWRWNRREVRWLRLGSVIVGMGFVLYLVYAELIQIGNICLWCTSVHVATFFIFALLVYEATSWMSRTTQAGR
ncbi:MAG TPA: vitamin K epoxide reductase family protein [Streptosporangiaceae bacterium]|nr:vitamin K epoxide reductase family protein [Streptosporangiaceae bacterium]